MGNKLNLIPLDIKQKRKRIEYTKTGLLISLIPGVLLGQVYLSIFTLDNKISETQENIRVAGTLESQIKEQEGIIAKNKSIVQELTSGGLPLNQFLLFTGLALPEDIRLYSITSASILEAEKEIGKEDLTEVVSDAKPVDAKEEQTTDGEVKEGEEVEEGVEVVVAEKPPEQVITPTNNNIIIKGAALNVNSIGVFMGDLERKNEYIRNVDIVEVQNYRDEVFNYKMFELIVELHN